jgi:ABC-type Fe3+-hydroxamate transport system substrate-binding protein
MILNMGVILDKQKTALKLVNEIKEKFKTASQSKKNAIYLIWKEPYMTIGGDTYINSLMQKAGFENIYINEKRYPTISLNEIIQFKPAFILLSSEPYPFKQKHIAELQQNLPTCKILLVDGEIFSWYGDTLLKAPEYFAKLEIEINNG